MKRAYTFLFALVFSLAVLTASSSFAGNYTISTHEIHVTKKDTGTDLLQIQVTNTTNADLTIKWQLLDNSIQWTGWRYQFCDLNTCYTTTQAIPNSATCLVDAKGTDAFSVQILSYASKATSGQMKVAFWDAANPSSVDTILFLIDATHLGINNNAVPAASVNIFPNPAVSSLNFSVTGNEFVPVKATVFSVTGQKMFEQKIEFGATQIPVGMLTNGMYYLKLEDKTGNGVVKTFSSGI